jgi:hypothetical protein
MIIIFWEMTPCGSYKNRRFGGSYRLHLQGERDEQVQSLLFRSVPARLVHPEDGGDTILRNVGSYKNHTASSPRRW